MPAVANAKMLKNRIAFKSKLEELHGDHIVALTEYNGSKLPVTIRCSAGHEYETKPEYLYQHGCRHCGYVSSGKSGRKTSSWYKAQIKVKHPRTKVLGSYVDSYTEIEHKCPCGTVFSVSPQSTLHGNRGTCISCSNKRRRVSGRLNQSEVINRIFEKHGEGVKLVGKYTGSLTKHKFRCGKGHEWETTPDAVMRISGCNQCNSPLKHSKVAIRWIEKVARTLRLTFVHAGNGKEKHLYGASGKRYYVDGFNVRKNIVLEFHGDTWHGNPEVYRPRDRPHSFSDLTAKQLHKKTMDKMKDLADAGYTVLHVWEKDYYEGELFSE